MARIWPVGDLESFIRLIDDPGHPILEGGYQLSDRQAKAILELRLQRLTGMEQEKLEQETNILAEKIKDLLDILASHERRMTVLREELLTIREQFANPRRTTIEAAEFEYDAEALIPREDMVVTVTHSGYIKRVPLSTYRTQNRGGKGRMGMTTKDDDLLVKVFVASTHSPLLFLSSKGLAYRIKLFQLPQGSPTTRGKAMVNILPLEKDELITAILPLPEDVERWQDFHILFATATGSIRRNLLSDFTQIRANGKIAMKLDPDDRLIGAELCEPDQDVFLATKKNRVIRFKINNPGKDGSETGVRIFRGRSSTGVRAIRLDPGDEVIQLALLNHSKEDAATRRSYLQACQSARRELAANTNGEQESAHPATGHIDSDDHADSGRFDDPALADMAEREEFIMSVSSNGQGQLSSAFDFRNTARGGKGISNMRLDRKQDEIIASFPVVPTLDHLILISDAGQIIRIAIKNVRKISRHSKGVILFNLHEGERIVSCAR
ncbi:MAG: DNA gyrase C-terminal beta-propeller domain-containing protein, partial [Pseudomonadota bacterium]